MEENRREEKDNFEEEANLEEDLKDSNDIDIEDKHLEGHTREHTHEHPGDSYKDHVVEREEARGEKSSDFNQEKDDERNVDEGNKTSENSSDESLKINKSELKSYTTFIVIAAVVIIAFGFFRGGFDTTGNVVAVDQEGQPSAGGRVEVSIDDDSVKGEADAPVTIIEFSDYECPFCGRFYTQTLGQIDEQYIKTGKVKLVYRDFPLNSIHPQAQKAAEAAECAGEQDKYYEYHDKLFENQRALSIDNLKSYAQEIGLDVSEFNSCLDSGKMSAEVAKDLQDGQKYGVQGTPAFFINGKLISGAQPFSVFQQAIEAEL